MSQLQNTQSLLGASIKVITTFEQEVVGELFCVDQAVSNSIVLRTKQENGNCDYKWLKTNIIREVIALGAPASGAAEEPLPGVNMKMMEARAKKVEEHAVAEQKKWGVGVTAEAQDVFDALSKTMEAEWEGENILVLGVKVVKPYNPDSDVKGDNKGVVERIKKVLKAEAERSAKRRSGK
eukprot:TRINITY_DN18614_c0_g1_i1.p1 TRINITY_DN18614_c0_g1~~TRINITY_DN18614_c0_g1_i1.p1  ORF type:complete len:180 (-),score=43.60 TRINITY_DN18614_c0_g1_i1:126-665(-)